MASLPPDDITQILNLAADGGSSDRTEAIERLYAELRRIANAVMAGEPKGHTLQPTAIATEAYLQLVERRNQNWRNRAHFFAAAAQVMRHILVDYGRKKRSQKRGGALQRVDLDKAAEVGIAPDADLIELDEAMRKLERLDPRQSRIVELRYFGGLSEEEIAEILKTSVRTVKREWSVARAWLYAELTRR